MTRPQLPATAARLGLVALVIAIAVVGHWAIPTALGPVTKFAIIALIELLTVWTIRRWLRRRDARR